MENKYTRLRETIEEYELQHFIHEEHYPYLQLKKIAKGEHIFNQHEPAEAFYILLTGKIRVYQVQSNGKMVVLNIIDRFRFLGDIELIYNKPTLNSIDLLEDSEFIVIPMQYCREVMLKDYLFLKEIAVNLAKCLYQVEINSTITTSFALEKRIFSYILSTEQDNYFELDLQTLPDLFGTTYRHFLRVIGKLKEEQIIEKKGDGFILNDRKALSQQIGDIYFFN